MTAHAILLLCTVDLQAQAPLINMKQYNGAYACNFCETMGVPRANHLHRNWPPVRAALRTHQVMIQNARDAISSCKSVRLMY